LDCTDLNGRTHELFENDCCYGLNWEGQPWTFRTTQCPDEGLGFEYCVECAN